jgi:hypothetical protein
LIKVNANNKMDIVRSYSHEVLDSMDWDSLYTFAYETLVEKNELLESEVLEREILAVYPHLLED